jgi:N-acetylneuraminic acid mutarotase
MYAWNCRASSTCIPPASYAPALDQWSLVSDVNMPAQMPLPFLAWTGSKLFTWSNSSSFVSPSSQGGLYDPDSFAWTAVSTDGPPLHSASTDFVRIAPERLFVYGGWSRLSDGPPHYETVGDGYLFDASDNTWTPISTANGPGPRSQHGTVWTGSEVIIWGGVDEESNSLNSGARYDPSTDTWTPMAAPAWLDGLTWPVAVWTGTEALFWNETGALYNPSTDTWRSMSTVNTPRSDHSKPLGVWTGDALVIFGGRYPTNVGGIWRP